MIGIDGPFVRVRLDELGIWRTGSTPSKSVPAYWRDGDLPWASPKDFGPPEIKDAIDHVTQIAVERGGVRPVPAGSLLVVARSGVLRHSLPVAVTAREVATNQDVKALLPAPGVNAAFLRHQLRAAAPQVLAAAVKAGTTVQSLDDSRFRNFEVLLPLPDEQRRIATQLDSFAAGRDGLLADLAAIRSDLVLVKEQVLAGAWDGSLARNWRRDRNRGDERAVASIGSLATRIAYGSSRKSRRMGDVAVLRMGNIKDGLLDWGDLVFTSDAEEIERHLLKDGDLLFNRTNSPELVGKSAVYHGERAAIAAGYNVVVRCGDLLLPDLLAYFINGPAGRAWCRAVRSDGVNQSNVSAAKLAAFEVPAPPMDEQRATVRLVELSLATLDRVEAELDGIGAESARVATLVYNAAFSADGERPSQELTTLLAGAERFKSERGDKERERRRTMAKRRPAAKPVEEIVRKAGAAGMTFEDLLATSETAYEELRGSVFSSLTARPPRLQQFFDEARRTMMLRVPAT